MDAVSLINHDTPSVQRILSAARTCFGRQGYKGASMSRIASEAEVSKSLLHYHFDSKQQLFVEVQLMLLRELLLRVRTFAQGPATATQFGQVLEHIMAFVESEVDDLRVLLEFHAQAASNPGVAAHLAAFNDEVTALVVDGLTNVLGPVVDRLTTPPERLARMLRTVFNGLIVELVYAPNDDARAEVRQVFDDVRAMVARQIFQEMS